MNLGLEQPKSDQDPLKNNSPIIDLADFVRNDEDFRGFVFDCYSDCPHAARETFLSALESAILALQDLTAFEEGSYHLSFAVSEKLIEPAEIQMAEKHAGASLVLPSLNFRQGIEERLTLKVEELSSV